MYAPDILECGHLTENASHALVTSYTVDVSSCYGTHTTIKPKFVFQRAYITCSLKHMRTDFTADRTILQAFAQTKLASKICTNIDGLPESKQLSSDQANKDSIFHHKM